MAVRQGKAGWREAGEYRGDPYLEDTNLNENNVYTDEF